MNKKQSPVFRAGILTHRALWLKATKSLHQIKRNGKIISPSSRALPTLIAVLLSLPFVSPFLGEGVPCDTENSL